MKSIVGYCDTLKELGVKRQMNVKYVSSSYYVGTDGEKFYQYTILVILYWFHIIEK